MCAPCATLTRLLPSLTTKYSQAEWEIVEVADASELTANAALQEYATEVKSFPTTLLLNDAGKVLDKQPGALGVDAMLSKHFKEGD